MVCPAVKDDKPNCNTDVPAIWGNPTTDPAVKPNLMKILFIKSASITKIPADNMNVPTGAPSDFLDNGRNRGSVSKLIAMPETKAVNKVSGILPVFLCTSHARYIENTTT